jgi:hypothetical protein
MNAPRSGCPINLTLEGVAASLCLAFVSTLDSAESLPEPLLSVNAPQLEGERHAGIAV